MSDSQIVLSESQTETMRLVRYPTGLYLSCDLCDYLSLIDATETRAWHELHQCGPMLYDPQAADDAR
jgi:hypothetical protein